VILVNSEILDRIQTQQLVSYFCAENINKCGYTLRVGKVFEPKTGKEELINVMEGNRKSNTWEIGPSETLVVRTREKVKMPPDLCATYAPLYRLARKGVMLLNASIVEPGYEGPLSCFLVNFSSQRLSLRENEAIAKITFHTLTKSPAAFSPDVVTETEYEASLADSAKGFHKSFMDISGVEDRAAEKAAKEVKRWVIGGGVLVAFLVLWASLEPVLTQWFWEKTGVLTSTQRVEDVKLLKDLENAELNAQLKSLSAKVDKLEEKLPP
jgi:deoxycytidine triphosphate deaminase